MINRNEMDEIYLGINELCDFVNSEKLDSGDELPVIVKAISTDDSKDAEILKRRERLNDVFKILGIRLGTYAIAQGTAGMLLPVLPVIGLVVPAFFIAKKLYKKMNTKYSVDEIVDNMKLCGSILADKEKDLKTKLEEVTASSKPIIDDLYDNLAVVVNEEVEYLEQSAKKTAIFIDDNINAGVNKRIERYNEIVLKQFNSQKLLAETLISISEKNKEMHEKIEECQKEIDRLNQVIYTYNMLGKAVTESGKGVQ